MVRELGLIIVASLAFCQSALADQKKIFEVTFNEAVRGGVRTVSVSFYERVPPKAAAEKILRQSLEQAVTLDPSQDILATAFDADDNALSKDVTSQFVYTAKTKKIEPFDFMKALQ